MKRMLLILLSLIILTGGEIFSAGKYRKAIFYHHSTGGCFYDRQNLYDNSTPSSVPTVPKEVAKYNTAHGFSVNTSVSMSEQWMPSDPTGNNWSDWASAFSGCDFSYSVIIIKTCYLQQQTMASSSDIGVLKSYYRNIVTQMKNHPANFFVIWNNVPAPTDGLSDRAVWSASFSAWCKDTLATGKDKTFGAFPKNVYVFDIFRKLADPITGYCDPKYGNPGDDHPSNASVTLVTPQFVQEVFDAAITFEKTTGIKSGNTVPSQFKLEQNYPNPFNPTTTIQYTLDQGEYAKIVITDALGQIVFDTPYEFQTIGQHTVLFDGSSLASGVYFYTLQTPGTRSSRVMNLLK